jgi:hypothetical protein
VEAGEELGGAEVCNGDQQEKECRCQVDKERDDHNKHIVFFLVAFFLGGRG